MSSQMLNNFIRKMKDKEKPINKRWNEFDQSPPPKTKKLVMNFKIKTKKGE